MLEISWLLCGFLYFLLYCYLLCKIVNKQEFEINLKLIILALISSLFDFIILKINVGFLQPYLIHIMIFIMLKIFYKETFVKTMIILLLILIITFLSEVLFGLSFILLINMEPEVFKDNWLGYLIINFLMCLNSILIIRFKKLNRLMTNIINWYNENEFKSLLILISFSLIIMTFLLYNNFIKLLPNSFLWITNLFCIGVFVFIIGFFREKANNNKIVSEYDQLLNYVKTYEKLLEEKNKNQHEYKNQLLVIKSMISVQNKTAIKYIDEYISAENNQKNSEWLNKLKYIPQGGLKGLIYYKIEEMIYKKINIYIDISSELENTNLNKYFKNLQDISKVIGVYLDNAIEAATNSKQKYIIIEVFLEKKVLVFKISNTYNGSIDLSKIDNEGYTTKGKGKGYGLSLVKDIISKNDSLEQARELNGIYYVQKLNIKK